MRVACPYCHAAAELVSGNVIYPSRPDLVHRQFWRCARCDAWVGCHPGTADPLGRLANAPLRKARQRVHALLDPMWKSGAMKRTAAYQWLARKLAMAEQNCHVGMFDLDTCKAACEILSTRYG